MVLTGCFSPPERRGKLHFCPLSYNLTLTGTRCVEQSMVAPREINPITSCTHLSRLLTHSPLLPFTPHLRFFFSFFLPLLSLLLHKLCNDYFFFAVQLHYSTLKRDHLNVWHYSCESWTERLHTQPQLSSSSSAAAEEFPARVLQQISVSSYEVSV